MSLTILCLTTSDESKLEYVSLNNVVKYASMVGGQGIMMSYNAVAER